MIDPAHSIYIAHALKVSLYRGQCEELRAVLSKRHQDEVCQERAEQLRMKQETQQKEQQGQLTIHVQVHVD